MCIECNCVCLMFSPSSPCATLPHFFLQYLSNCLQKGQIFAPRTGEVSLKFLADIPFFILSSCLKVCICMTIAEQVFKLSLASCAFLNSTPATAAWKIRAFLPFPKASLISGYWQLLQFNFPDSSVWGWAKLTHLSFQSSLLCHCFSFLSVLTFLFCTLYPRVTLRAFVGVVGPADTRSFPKKLFYLLEYQQFSSRFSS